MSISQDVYEALTRRITDLQAERDRWLQLSKDYGERIESLEEEVAAVCAHRDEEKERAERYRATAELILDALESTGTLPAVCKTFRAALADQPEQPTHDKYAGKPEHDQRGWEPT